MKISQFIRVCRSEKVKSAQIMDVANKDIFDVEKIVFSHKTKRFYFDDKDGANQIKPIISTKDIAEISRVECYDDNQYIFALRLKDDRVYSIDFEMEDGYTPFLLKQREVDNIKAVGEAIPQYLDRFKGESVEVRKTQFSQIYSTCNIEGDKMNLSTERYVINDFDYTVNMASGFPLIKLLDKGNEDFYNIAFGVRLIDEYNINSGEFSTSDSVVVHADSGDYFLTCID